MWVEWCLSLFHAHQFLIHLNRNSFAPQHLSFKAGNFCVNKSTKNQTNRCLCRCCAHCTHQNAVQSHLKTGSFIHDWITARCKCNLYSLATNLKDRSTFLKAVIIPPFHRNTEGDAVIVPPVRTCPEATDKHFFCAENVSVSSARS